MLVEEYKEKIEFEDTMMEVLIDSGKRLSKSEWQKKFISSYPKYDTFYYGDKFRNAQQLLKRRGCINLVDGKWNFEFYMTVG